MAILNGGVAVILPFLIVLTVLIFVHELGHYSIARRAGVKIEIFSIGFGPELFGWFDKRGTRWRVSAVPFGGYVKMFGDADAASTPGAALPTMTPEERAVSFHHKSLGARAAIIAGGPAANFLFAIVVLAVVFATVGQMVTPAEVSEVTKGSAAEAAGLQPGDLITAADGRQITSFEELRETVQLNTGTPISLSVERSGISRELTLVPHVIETTDLLGHHTYGQLGVQHNGGVTFIHRSPPVAVWEAVHETWNLVGQELTGVWQMITGARSTEELGGPIRIAKLSGAVAKGGVVALLDFMAVLSVNLGLVNLFPIPVLDGGHLLFYAAEAVRGRPLGQRAQEFGFRIGLALVLTLMVFATWNDLAQLGVFAFLKGLVT